MSQNRIVILLIVLAVFLWGATLAAGAYLNHTWWDNPLRVWRAVVVLLFVEAFLGFWLLMLYLKRH